MRPDAVWNRTLRPGTPVICVAAGRNTHGHDPVERYRFDDLWCLHRYRYRFRLALDGDERVVPRGSVTLIPPRVPMAFRYPRENCRQRAHPPMTKSLMWDERARGMSLYRWLPD